MIPNRMTSEFESFLEKFKHPVPTLDTNKPYTPSDRLALIVEPRGYHPFLSAVIRNAIACLDGSWRIQLWTGEEYISSVERELADLSDRLEMKPLSTSSITQNVYNILLMSPFFWESVGSEYEHILLFQTDCVFFKPFEEKWFDYDYVGANYYNSRDLAPFSGGVQGGLSYRKRSVMLDCVRRISVEDVNAYRIAHRVAPIDNMNEDVYFTHACEMTGRRMPTPSARPTFAIEADYHSQTFGHHGWNKPYFTQEQRKMLIKNATV